MSARAAAKPCSAPRPPRQRRNWHPNAGTGDGVVIQGNYGNWNGVAYAPHANVKLTGSSNVKDPHASLVGWTIQTTGAGQTLIYGDSLFPQPTAAEITLYE